MPEMVVGDRPSPLVSVIMPVFNPGEHLEEAITSVLNQTYRDLELVIVREYGSKDRLASIVDELQDDRIILINNETRLGLARSLNFGIRKAHGDLIARMDSDDVSMPSRLEKQVKFMSERPDVGILGTHLSFVRGVPSSYDNSWFPSDPIVVKWRMHFHNALAHPTVMMRREVWEKLGGYSYDAEPCEDYELWLRAMRMTNIANIPEPLVTYRILEESVSGSRREEQRQKAQELAIMNMQISIGKNVERRYGVAAQSPYDLIDPRDGKGGARLIRMLHASLLMNNRACGLSSRTLNREVAMRMSPLLLRTFSRGPIFSLSIVWEIAQSGLPVLGHTTNEVLSHTVGVRKYID